MPSARRPRFVLGTAQLGLSYGVANRSGKPDRSLAVRIIREALDAGVRTLDTAHCYGDSEAVIAEALTDVPWDSPVEVFTKVDTPLKDQAAALSDAVLAAMAHQGVEASCRELQRDTLDTILVREAWPLTRPEDGFWALLVRLKQKGVVARLGLSAQSPAEVALALETPGVDHIQLPYNVLDYRWRDTGVLERLAARPRNITVHVRSVFLQGLLAAGGTTPWPSVAQGCGPQVLAALERALLLSGRETAAELCVAYVRSQEWIDGVVLGVETLAQLRSNLALMSKPVLSGEEIAVAEGLLPRVPAGLLDPSCW